MLQVLTTGMYPVVAPSGSAQAGSQGTQRTQARGRRGFGDFGPPRGDPSPAWRAHWTGGNRDRPGKNERLGVPWRSKVGPTVCFPAQVLGSVQNSCLELHSVFLSLSHVLDSQYFEFCPLFKVLSFATFFFSIFWVLTMF